MDTDLLPQLPRWPNVPACYGWLALDPRGQWRLGEDGGAVVHHGGLKAFLNRNYARTEGGEWFVQNGPQRVFVTLLRAPYIVRNLAAGRWETHTGLEVRHISEALLDAEGNAYLVCEHGLAGIDDRDLGGLLGTVEAHDDATSPLALTLGSKQLLLQTIAAEALPARFGFVRQPQKAAS